MAFCTTCGATLTGAFCTQCGTPVGVASGQTTPPPAAMSPENSGAMPSPSAPARRRTSPLVWILVIILGIFVLGGIATFGTGWYLIRNRGEGLARIIAARNPDLEVISTDNGAHSITVRDKRTGKVVTMDFNSLRRGGFRITAEGDDGKEASVEIGATTGKLPSWVPEYPGSKVEGTFAVRGDTGDDTAEGGSFHFTTSDPASKVMSFYQDKFKDLGMKINVTATTNEGGTLVATDEDEKRSLTVVVAEDSSTTNVNVNYGRKK